MSCKVQAPRRICLLYPLQTKISLIISEALDSNRQNVSAQKNGETLHVTGSLVQASCSSNLDHVSH